VPVVDDPIQRVASRSVNWFGRRAFTVDWSA
jgi:hypothetical protein